MIRFDMTAEQLIDLLEYRELRARGALGIGRIPISLAERLSMEPRQVARLQARTIWSEAEAMAFDANALEKARAELKPDHMREIVRRELSLIQSKYPELFEQHRVERERDLENEFVRLLTEAGIEAHRQVRTERGKADVVVGEYVIEVKLQIKTWADLHRAIGQAKGYAEMLNKPKTMIVAGSIGPRVKMVETGVPCLAPLQAVEHLKAA